MMRIHDLLVPKKEVVAVVNELNQNPAKKVTWQDFGDLTDFTQLPKNRLVIYSWDNNMPTEAIKITNNTSSERVDFKILEDGEKIIFISLTSDVPCLILPESPTFKVRISPLYCNLDS